MQEAITGATATIIYGLRIIISVISAKLINGRTFIVWTFIVRTMNVRTFIVRIFIEPFIALWGGLPSGNWRILDDNCKKGNF